MYLRKLFRFLIVLCSFHACIQDDFLEDTIDPVLRINSQFDTIQINTSIQLDYTFFNNIGKQENLDATFSSSNVGIVSISEEGLITGHTLGEALIIVTVIYQDDTISTSKPIIIGTTTSMPQEELSVAGSIVTTSSYLLEGDFEFNESIDGGVTLEFADNYAASTALPGLYIYLSNNKNSVANALTIGKVEVFNGAHNYEVPDVAFFDYQYIVYFCKPFNVKVGDGSL